MHISINSSNVAESIENAGLRVNIIERKRKTSGCEADICFSCAINEQAVCEADQKARKRGLASEYDKKRKTDWNIEGL